MLGGRNHAKEMIQRGGSRKGKGTREEKKGRGGNGEKEKNEEREKMEAKEEMKEKFRRKLFKNVDELKDAIVDLWVTGMPQEYCRVLARSMPNRLQAVVNAGGCATKY